MKQYLAALLLVFVTLLNSTPSQAGDPVVMGMGDRFLDQLPSDWHSEMGGWDYFDVEACFTGPGICYGSNPTSPYGSPHFPHPDTGLDSWELFLKRDEAIVVFLRTPPQNRYYAFTQYLMRSAGVASPEFASLSDSLNNLQVGTTRTADNQTVFDQYAVLVWTPDLGTRDRIYSMLASMGVDSRSINFIPLPVSIPGRSFKFGSGSNADSFNMLMRTALPANQTAMNAYLDEAPFFVAKVGPNVTGVLNASPTVGYANEITGRSEGVIFPNAQRALDMLTNDIKKKYSASFSLAAQAVDYTEKVGWECITGGSTCAGDNHDALYSRDTEVIRVGNLEDFVLIVGVNHQKTGKATYLNHSVYDTKKIAGIVGVADSELTAESALYHAGLSGSDPKAAAYKNLYAYIISYKCAGRLYCLQIPAPTPSNPVGLQPKAPFLVVGRSYMEPLSQVRPAQSEVIKHKVFVATKRR